MAQFFTFVIRIFGWATCLVAAQALASTTTAFGEEVSLAGQKGPLKGAYLEAGESLASVLIIPGSGPVDRDGNSPVGIKTDTYLLLAEGLAEKGISSLRIDKRGMFSSQAAISDGNNVTIEDYADDVLRWSALLAEKTGHDCVWILGHSEGGLVALKAVETDVSGICGLLLAAAPGRPLGELLREQLRANPANASLLPKALAIIESLESGQTVPERDVPPSLKPLFTTGLQTYMINLFSHNPVALMRAYSGPSLVLQGGRDLQVKVQDATLLEEAGPNTVLIVVEHMSHMLKTVEGDGPAANMATYTNPELPLSEGVVPALSKFVLTRAGN